jgi:hypothetical protein
MSSLVEAVRALAFHTAPAADANAAIADARARHGGGTESVSYEIALPALNADEFLKRRALAKLVYFLDCRGARVPQSGGVFVSLFTPEGLVFVDAGLFAEAVGNVLGLDAEALHARYGDGGTGDPKLLGT